MRLGDPGNPDPPRPFSTFLVTAASAPVAPAVIKSGLRGRRRCSSWGGICLGLEEEHTGLMRNALSKAGDGRAAAACEARLSSAPVRSPPGQDAAVGTQPNLAPQPAPTQTPSPRCHRGFAVARAREAGASLWGAAPHHQLEAMGRSWGDSDPNGTGR